MVKSALKAKSPLNGYAKSFGDTHLTEVSDLAIVSVAIPLGGEKALKKALKTAFGATLPKVGTSTTAQDGNVQFLGMAQDQIFVIFPYAEADADHIIAEKLGAVAYYTLQSDNWSVLRLSGDLCLPALERTCQLDLDLSAFPVGHVARTAMEHMGCVLFRIDQDQFLLMSLSSMAQSFLHAIKTSLANVS